MIIGFPIQHGESSSLTKALGETRVVNFEEELAYMAKTSQPLKDIAQIILDTGLRPEEVFRIRIENLDFRDRTIFNPFGKTKAARREVSMTADVAELLKRRVKMTKGPFVFPAKGNAERPMKAHDAAVENAGFSALRFAAACRLPDYAESPSNDRGWRARGSPARSRSPASRQFP
jgi:integrase